MFCSVYETTCLPLAVSLRTNLAASQVASEAGRSTPPKLGLDSSELGVGTSDGVGFGDSLIVGDRP